MEVTLEKAAKEHAKENSEHSFSDKQLTNVFCPIKDVLDRVADKWSIYAITKLGCNGKMRFNELKKAISGISQRMLTVTLRHLEEDGLISRTIYPEIPPRVEYELTELGRGLLQQLVSLSKWATENMGEILHSRESHCPKKENSI
ncbi:winged helix-turn-helix transcriptional regulator [Rubrolithibacter danxiaensis]|uniref:winged helix-turn-helix transcriptional regulator n=1 Tax=Rubrolithibacter danxiaensis TaxID=3390805 RepID=UPI003BF7E38F